MATIKKYCCRALLNSGSQAKFITEKIVNKLNLEREKSKINIIGITGGCSATKYKCNIHIESRKGSYANLLTCLVTPKITNFVPTRFIDKTLIKIPKNINLADENYNQPAEIDMLIGNQLFHKILRSGKLEFDKGELTLSNTVFGWIFSGAIADNVTANHLYNFSTTELINESES